MLQVKLTRVLTIVTVCSWSGGRVQCEPTTEFIVPVGKWSDGTAAPPM